MPKTSYLLTINPEHDSLTIDGSYQGSAHYFDDFIRTIRSRVVSDQLPVCSCGHSYAEHNGSCQWVAGCWDAGCPCDGYAPETALSPFQEELLCRATGCLERVTRERDAAMEVVMVSDRYSESLTVKRVIEGLRDASPHLFKTPESEDAKD